MPVRGLARGSEVDGAVTSPTLTNIVNELTESGTCSTLICTESCDELFDTAFEDYSLTAAAGAPE